MPRPAEPPPRDRILDAVERVVVAKGVSGLTLDAVAREAEVSKGGLLHYFASKEALLNAMLQRMTDFLVREHAQIVDRMSPGKGRVARAVLAWAFGDVQFSPGDARHDRIAAVFLAAFHHDPALLDPMREFSARLKADLVADGLPDGEALILLMACDGLFMAQMFKTQTFTAAERAAMRAVLDRIAGERP